MNTDKILLQMVVRYFSLSRRLYLQGKISRDYWLEINDAITQFLQQEIE